MNFPDTSDNPRKLFELYDLLSELAALMKTPKYEHLLSYNDTAAGVNHVVGKLREKEEISLSPMTKAPTPAEMSKVQSDNINNATKMT